MIGTKMVKSKDSEKHPEIIIEENFDNALKLLNIPLDELPSLTPATLKKKYYQASLAVHPDRRPDKYQAEEEFKLISSCYNLINQFLSDEEISDVSTIKEAGNFLQKSSPEVQDGLLKIIAKESNRENIKNKMLNANAGDGFDFNFNFNKNEPVDLNKPLADIEILLSKQVKDESYTSLVNFFSSMSKPTRITLGLNLAIEKLSNKEIRKKANVQLMSTTLDYTKSILQEPPIEFKKWVAYLSSAPSFEKSFLLDIIKESKSQHYETLRRAVEMHKVSSYYSHATESGSRKHKYEAKYEEANALKKNYNALKGDALKTKILIDIQTEIDNTSTPKELADVLQAFIKKPEYTILETQQGRISQKLGLETSSLKAFNRMVGDAEERIAKANANANSPKK